MFLYSIILDIKNSPEFFLFKLPVGSVLVLLTVLVLVLVLVLVVLGLVIHFTSQRVARNYGSFLTLLCIWAYVVRVSLNSPVDWCSVCGWDAIPMHGMAVFCLGSNKKNLFPGADDQYDDH